MKIYIFLVSLVMFSVCRGDTWPAAKPKLVVVLVIDQFRADYLSRFSEKFGKNGFKALIENGAYFPYGEYDILQSMTAPGHSTILTGAYPYQTGIPINDWYDPKTKSGQYCVADSQAKSVSDTGESYSGRSPKNLVGTTVGDELKNAAIPSRVYALALKDRAAILLGGHRPDFVMWYENKASSWVSSDYYLKDRKLPSWVSELNRQTVQEKCDTTQACGISLTIKAAEALIEKYKLGAEKTTDVLAISFSSHDYAGHRHGPNSPIMEGMTLAEDRGIESLRATLERKVPGGLKNVLFVLTGDHGIPPTAEYLNDTRIAAGNINEESLIAEMDRALSKRFGRPKKQSWFTYFTDFNFYIDEEIIREKKLKAFDVEAEAKSVLIRHPEFAFVMTRSEVGNRIFPMGMFERQVKKTFYPSRSGHVIAMPKPFYTNVSDAKITHMTSYTYDRMVPIIFSGFGIRKGVYAKKAEVVDIAPTLSFMLGVLPPALSEGRVLDEVIKSVDR